ncbi:hypothetical protein K227x_45420 [Rubripirellula lacrimiformis]|uniref:Uncharacterized protein n=1 Tax=Rubripirellula lacrimiformis TaxID=1930273 RepID=A0A517NG75_9BACT|nr:hypothetical protein K227x_45420 [Rubripirellula lacrimiformis]
MLNLDHELSPGCAGRRMVFSIWRLTVRARTSTVAMGEISLCHRDENRLIGKAMPNQQPIPRLTVTTGSLGMDKPIRTVIGSGADTRGEVGFASA